MDLGRRPKAIALMSGGLDSTLAAKIVLDQGVEVTGLHLVSPFGCRTSVQKNADAVGVPVMFREKGEAYLDLVKNPRFGYGSQMNPCIDCRIFMFQLADVVRQDLGADFIVTGEVLGQRPMSQQRHSMELIDKHSPLKDRVLRPLSALTLEPTLPERMGWVDRDKLFQIAGRGRKRQFELADELGISEYEAPGGGCLLTEGSFTGRLKDFFSHEEGLSGELRLVQSELLRLGRHFRFHDQLKVIVGRNEAENKEIVALGKAARGTVFEPQGFSGPTALALGPVDEEVRQSVGSLIVRYGKGGGPEGFEIAFHSPEGEGLLRVVEGMNEERVNALKIV